MKRTFSIIDHDGRLLSRLEVKAGADGHEIDVSFERDFTRLLSVNKLRQARETHRMLCQVFPQNRFVVVQISKRRDGGYVVDLPDGERPIWISQAVESLGGTLVA